MLTTHRKYFWLCLNQGIHPFGNLCYVPDIAAWVWTIFDIFSYDEVWGWDLSPSPTQQWAAVLHHSLGSNPLYRLLCYYDINMRLYLGSHKYVDYFCRNMFLVLILYIESMQAKNITSTTTWKYNISHIDYPFSFIVIVSLKLYFFCTFCIFNSLQNVNKPWT